MKKSLYLLASVLSLAAILSGCAQPAASITEPATTSSSGIVTVATDTPYAPIPITGSTETPAVSTASGGGVGAPLTSIPMSTATATPIVPAPPEGGRVVTLADDGATIQLRVDQTFLLDLGDQYQWTIEIANQSIVSRVINVTVIRGAQGLYQAHMPGTTTLRAIGDPMCRQAQPPCMMPSRLFQIQIMVAP